MSHANLAKRGTLLIESGTYHRPDLRHFHVVCTDPDEDGRQLIVSISTINGGQHYDNACVLESHEHKFIKHPSFVKYAYAKITYRSQLLKKLANKKAKPYPPDLNNQTFQKVLNGIDTSEYIEPKARAYYHSRKQAVDAARAKVMSRKTTAASQKTVSENRV
tara:strand:+ start:945 stop:1430 length:486 start_codon:yes stop_codon:yes gene_type:complete